ncbi:hypothetical protein [Pseudoalteromonas sp. S3260]|uniref:hypothetical protein n=1 Tax=Pseudoalteromonas sp. S3260 TaxID=579534 RepID=UPI00201DD207|nr:hypothetical protein [Pseudoalteromonas sp. S3260]
MFKVHFSVVLATLFTLPVCSQEAQSLVQKALSNAPTIINLSANHPNEPVE